MQKRHVIFGITSVVLIAAGLLTPLWRLGGAGAMGVRDIGPIDMFFLDTLTFYGGLALAGTILISVFTVPKPSAVWVGVLSCIMALVFSVSAIMAAEQLSTEDPTRHIGPGPFLFIAGAIVAFIAAVLAVRASETAYPAH